jgi:hypothetical protein
MKIRNSLKKIYGKLSTYIHGTYWQLKEIIDKRKFDIIITFGFDNEFFNKCEELTNNVLDAIFYITLKRFFIIALKLKDNEMFIYWLKELKSTLCLEFLEKLKQEVNSPEKP